MEPFVIRQLEESWLLRNLTEEQKRQLLANSNIVKYKNRDVIFKQNTRTSHLVFILSGLIGLDLRIARALRERSNKISNGQALA